MVIKKKSSNKDETVYRFNIELMREVSMLWINNIAPSQAPSHTREALRELYKHLDSAKLGVGLTLQIRTGDCKTPDQLRQLACEAVDKLNEYSANALSPTAAMAKYYTWTKARGIATSLLGKKVSVVASTPTLSHSHAETEDGEVIAGHRVRDEA